MISVELTDWKIQYNNLCNLNFWLKHIRGLVDVFANKNRGELNWIFGQTTVTLIAHYLNGVCAPPIHFICWVIHLLLFISEQKNNIFCDSLRIRIKVLRHAHPSHSVNCNSCSMNRDCRRDFVHGIEWSMRIKAFSIKISSDCTTSHTHKPIHRRTNWNTFLWI